MTMTRGMICIATALGLLTACGEVDPILMNLNRDSGPGPDEFSILPTEELVIPDDLTALPEPNPGGVNRADPDPEAAAIAALGGNIDRGGAASGGLVSHVTRFGIEQGIRGTLAAEDLEFRRDNNGRPLERWFNLNVYHQAYEDVSLDQYAELERLRRLGIRTPAAPPEGELDN